MDRWMDKRHDLEGPGWSDWSVVTNMIDCVVMFIDTNSKLRASHLTTLCKYGSSYGENGCKHDIL